MSDLPIESIVPELRSVLARGTSSVVQAPPGAGKTTRLPLALLDEPWLEGRRIVMLEPRRLATRAAARRMADTLGERVGETVGYRIRRDTRVGPRTRIEVVTEGVLTRLINADPALEQVGLVIFDEFHERNLHGDLGLALALQSQALLRPDLRILVMSATLDGAAVSRLLGGAPVVTSEGRSFPVETRYVARRDEIRVEAAVASAVREAIQSETGDILAFLPGAGEIHRAAALLAEPPLPAAVSLVRLFGELPQEEQDRAIRPSPPGRRKVVLATSIAETSLTIEGVRVVIDGGLARVPRYSPASGMTRLVTVRVSRASADQRRGRAGRLGPGACYRLWAEGEQGSLLPKATPEILETDLAPLALELAAAGIADPGELSWLDPPPAAAFAEARALLQQLGGLDAGGRITPHGRELAGLGTHPRIGHMLLRARALGHGHAACGLAALLEERDILRGEGGAPDPDMQWRLEIVLAGERGQAHRHAVDRDRLARVREIARDWRRELDLSGDPPTGEASWAGLLLSFAYPDRIGQRRAGQAGRFLLRNGQGAVTADPAMALADWIVAADLDGDRRESRIWRAAALTLEEIEAGHADEIEIEEEIEWDESAGAVVARRCRRLGALVLAGTPLRDPPPDRVAAVLLDAVARDGIERLPWSDAATRLRQRLAFLHRLDPDWPDVSDDALLANLGDWMGPRLAGLRRREQVAALDLEPALLSLITWEQKAKLDRVAPTHLEVPSGSRIAVDYGDPGAPVLAVRLQEIFGWTRTPTVVEGRVPLTLHLLSPARRPVQVTRDLAGFWRTTYFDVKKDLKGRYPKHSWPDDPLSATPTRRAKPRS
jgi:ATP-dependent helicase HrpB